MINVVLCGGSGTRLWPMSRKKYPKQFAEIFEGKSLFQLTVERNCSLCSDFYIILGIDQYFLASEQLENIKTSLKGNTKYLLETIGRNTAPAIALACMSLDYDKHVIVTPSDHLIRNKENYENAINRANELAEQDYLVTFGIIPSYPETGYGYIESFGEDVRNFKEKPSFKMAKEYMENNKQRNKDSIYYWNSGMFCFKAGVFLEELSKYSPDIYCSTREAFENRTYLNNDQFKIPYDFMSAIPSNSIDYAVMEKSDKVKVVESNFEWTDVGSFDALYNETKKDEFGNSICTNHIALNSKNNLIIGSKRKIATVDVDDMIIVDTDDVLLVSRKGSSQKVKQVTEKLDKEDSCTDVHTTVHRPWGTYTILDEQESCKVKRIAVKPGKRLSLQKHYHRDEHWTVVNGIADVTIEDNTYELTPNESVFIGKGQKHRLANNGKKTVEIIEIQYGSYTGEDDIVRIEDDFERT